MVVLLVLLLLLPLVLPPLPPPPLILLLIPVLIMAVLFFLAFSPALQEPNSLFTSESFLSLNDLSPCPRVLLYMGTPNINFRDVRISLYRDKSVLILIY
ncbi:hypothetical protein CUMW_240810 [Citrus unshiu]|uniref:Uncharacterized protein n=1 Tax=Citrus unshiu TaxID=55188 RepID=A0A2H5QL99_CITUN|nr:hypothetical protein CUMW_240810 [Citrus unshiu]